MSKSKDICDDIKMISRPKGIYDKSKKSKSKELLEEAIKRATVFKARFDIPLKIQLEVDVILDLHRKSHTELLKEVKGVVDGININDIAKKYKEKTGYVNLLGSIEKELKSILPIIKAELKSALEKMEKE